MLKIALEIIGLLGGVATVLGLLLAPMIYIGGKIDNLRKDMHAEMKDFHGKLCAIEERNKK